MRQIKKITYEYTLTEEELAIIYQLLQYGRHRLKKHPNCGLSKTPKVRLEKIEALIRDYEHHACKMLDEKLDAILCEPIK